MKRRGFKTATGAAMAALLTTAYGQNAAPAFNYAEALQKSMFFYEAQRSGKLPASNRVNWRGDSALKDGAAEGVDLTGGWYDAGDHVKFGFPMAGAATMLAWGAIENPDGYAGSGQMPFLLDNLRWATDYFLRASAVPNELWGQVGAGADDHAWWGPAEALPMARPAFRITKDCPGSDLAGETAAALAASSMVFRRAGDADYADTLLARAKSLFAFADTYRGRYSDCIVDASGYYQSWSGYTDELVWAAAWIYRAGGDPQYLARARDLYPSLQNQDTSDQKAYKWTLSWDDKSYGVYVLMSQLTGDPAYRADAERWLDYWTAGFHGQRVRYTPGGLAWLDQWGSLRYAANTAFLAFVYSDWLDASGVSPDLVSRYRAFAKRQIDYILGDNPRKASYVVGFGDNAPKNPHHRTAHGSWSNDIGQPALSVHTLFGALVGGPDENDAYTDARTDFIHNEVATDYNAAFSGALARLCHDLGGTPLENFPQPETPTRDELYIEASVNAQGDNYVDVSLVLNNRSAWPARRTDSVTARYFFTLLSDRAEDATASGGGGCTIKGPARWSPMVFYIEADCTSAPLYPGGQEASQRRAQFRIARATASDNANDWSFSDLLGASAPVMAPHIAMYNAGVKVWGEEPPSGPADPLSIATTDLPTAVAGQSYRAVLGGAGGIPPYRHWNVAQGALPAGLTLDPVTGEISGMPVADGASSFAVSVADATITTASASLQMAVNPALPLVVKTAAFPTAYLQGVYRAALEAEGGVPPFAWSVDSGQLPAGLVINGSSVVGYPVIPGDSNFVLAVVDRNGTTAKAAATLHVSAGTAAWDGSIRLQYKNGFPNPTGNQVGPQFKLKNAGSDPVQLSDLEVRYYFTYDGVQKLNDFCDWAAFGCASLLARFVPVGSGLYYLENRFDIAAGSLAPGDSVEFQNRFAKEDWSNFDQSQDYSFDPTATTFREWSKVTVYRNGVLVWGEEPPR